MNSLEFKDNFAFIYLNKEIYSKAAILSSLEIYKDFIDYILLESEKVNTIKISLKVKDYTLEEIASEFLNYIISEEYSNLK